ncbi:MAG: hypothetical protein PHC51_14340 [bacterium]|nr:hypothetical protein [bacterium]
MPIKITLRKSKDISPFRRLLNMLFSSPVGQSAILCSGYIWQPNTGKYNILDDGLRNAIASGCSGGSLTTVAGKFYPSYYENYYRNFVRDLRANGIKVNAYYAPKKNWHAKVAIKLNNNIPIAALVGSSNLTGHAYGENRNWNFEADVLIWSRNTAGSGYFRDDDINQEMGKMELILDPDIHQPDEDAQLKSIMQDIIEAELEIFD